MAGPIYTIPFSLFGIIAAKYSDQFDRRLALGIILILASITMGESAFTDSIFIFGLMRAFHGMLNASTNPLSFSLI
jgi:MFS family permease